MSQIALSWTEPCRARATSRTSGRRVGSAHAGSHGPGTRAQAEESSGVRGRLAGLEPGTKTPELALELLESYRDRYRPVAVAAGMADEFDTAGPLDVVEKRVGTGSTDFWAISFSPSAFEHEPMDDKELDHKIALLRACWQFFDAVATRVSAEMRKGPRGGGRDRDQIVRHTIRTESEDFAKRLGLRVPEGGALTPKALRDYRETYVAAMRAYNAGEGKRMRSWNLPFLIRHSAFHAMDHAWEMEDKDLTAAG